MRRVICAAAFLVVSLGAGFSNAQVYLFPTPPPRVTAQADWQINGEPVYFDGIFFYRTGPTVFFNGSVMVQSGLYKGVPLYQDVTVEPYSIFYVPVGGQLMRPYERRRAGELAGTTGSYTPSFPVELEVEAPEAFEEIGVQAPPFVETAGEVFPRFERHEIAACAAMLRQMQKCRAIAKCGTANRAVVPSPGPTAIESIPPPSGNLGIYIDFEGARWFSAGRAVSFEAGRFAPSGDYRGFPVYRARDGRDDEIFVTVASDGLLAPYRR